MQAGHSVVLAGRPDFAGLVAEYGVDFAPVGHPYQPFITGAAEASAPWLPISPIGPACA